MVFIIGGIIIGFILGVLDDGFGFGIITGILGFFVGIILFLFVGGIIGCNLQTKEIVTEQEICALNDTSSVEGAHYLFSGYIDEKLVCRYVVYTDRGKHIEEVKADDVYINEGDYIPTVKIHNVELAKDWYYWFAHEAFVDGYYVEFYVPENTVTNEYNIDLK